MLKGALHKIFRILPSNANVNMLYYIVAKRNIGEYRSARAA